MDRAEYTQCEPSGNRTAPKTTGAKWARSWHFRGKMILQAVVEDLLNSYGLRQSNVALLMGTSAGGVGVMLNADFVHGMLKQAVPNIVFRALMDSGWFVDMKAYGRCKGIGDCLEPRIAPEHIEKNHRTPTRNRGWPCALANRKIQGTLRRVLNIEQDNYGLTD